MDGELETLCVTKYGERWWLGLAADISRLSGAPLRQVQRTTLRWKNQESDPTPVGVVAIKLLTASDEKLMSTVVTI